MSAVIGLVFQHKHLQSARRQFERQLVQSQTEFITALEANHKQARREAALRLWDEWVSGTLDSEKRSILLAFLKWLEIERDPEVKKQWISFFAQGGRVPREQFKKASISKTMQELFLADVAEGNNEASLSIQDLERIRTTLVTFLNIMEKVAAAYQYHAVDQEIISAAFKGNIVQTTTELNDLINEFRKSSHSTTWKILTDLVFEGKWAERKIFKETKTAADDV